MRTHMILTLVALAALVSCTKESLTPDLEPEAPKGISFELTASHPNDTKALKTAWESGDAVFVFFSNIAAPKYLKMSFDGSSWQSTEMDGDSPSAGCLGLSNGVSGTMRAVYLPFGSGATVSASNGSFVFSEDYYTYYLTDSQAYTVDNNKVSGTFQMAVPDGFVQFFVDDTAAENGKAILREAHMVPTAISSISSSGTVEVKKLSPGGEMPGYVYDKTNKTVDDSKGYLFSGILGAVNAQGTSTDYWFYLKAGQTEKTATAASKTMYTTGSTGRAANITNISWQDASLTMVDMGLDSGTLWANRNVGAVPIYNEYGSYFAWGETAERQENHNFSTYKWCNGSTYKELAKYTFEDWWVIVKGGTYPNGLDGKTQLDPEDDAATAVLGAQYSTPTAEDWLELWNSDNCTCTWTYISGLPSIMTVGDAFYVFASRKIYGCRVTSKKNGNSIFFPAASRWMDNPETNTPGNDTSDCQYWSATLRCYGSDTNKSSSEALIFNPSWNSVSCPSNLSAMSGQGRYVGLPVRPVMHN